MEIKPWMKQPGELHDKNGVPIYPGDLIRSFHFRGARRKVYYLYHTACYIDGAMRMEPTCKLDPSKRNCGGGCLMSQDLLDGSDAEVIQGSGPGRCLDHADRKKIKLEKTK